MRRKMLRSISLTLTSILCLVVLQQAALAGPPLICHPFEIGSARSLPWTGPQWRGVNKSYDTSRLVEDTLALLTPETPVLVRMETLRRATVYGLMPTADVKVKSPVKDVAIATELLARLKARVPEPGSKSNKRAAALAMFDYGYLIESYRQTGNDSGGPKLAGDVDGYALIVKSIGLRGGDAEMELGAALACGGKRQQNGRYAYVVHVQRSAEGAGEGSLLAKNLLSHFNHLGNTIAELRASATTAKN